VEYLPDNALVIYTDGSCYPKPRRGGIGILFVWTDDDGNEAFWEEDRAGYIGATNNEMELKSCIEALHLATGRRPPVDLSRFDRILIFTDSTYIHDHFNKAKFEWRANGWKRSGGAPVENAPLWKELVRLAKVADQAGARVEVKWIQGKSSPHSKRADKLAKSSAGRPSGKRVSQERVRRKKGPGSVEPGSVRMEGQRVTIYVISDKWQPIHKLVRHRYEVVSEDSPYHQCVDFIYAAANLEIRSGHTYDVQFNDDTGNPRITGVFGEVVST
jgi:ribonuclease HI